jgi:hypothetical protein
MAPQYKNRTDLSNPALNIERKAAKGQTYGEAGRQIAAQKAVPMGQSPVEAAPPPPAPGSMGTLDRMTANPDEPLTAGMDFGAGPGREILAAPGGQENVGKDDLIQRLRLAVAKYPNPNLIQLLIALES